MATTVADELSQSPFFGRRGRQPAAAPVAQNLVRQPAAAAPTPDATRGEGTLTKYRPIGGWQNEGWGANLVANTAEVGEPTSFNAGAGAPPAAEVVRGMRMTYTNPAAATPGGGYNPTPGRGTAEFATSTEAGQAFNRGQRGAFMAEHPVNPNVTYPVGSSPEEQANAKFGSYRETGQTGKEIAATKEPPSHGELWRKQGELVDTQRAGVEATNRKTEIANNQATLRKQLEEEIGTQDPKTGNFTLPTDPNLQGIHKKMDRLAMQGVSPEEAYKAVAPELHKHYYTPENVYGAIGLMEKQTGRPLPPELRQQLMSGTPEAMATLYPFTRQAAQQPRGVVSRTLSPAPAVGPGQPAASGSNLAPQPISPEADVFGAGGSTPMSPQETGNWQAEQRQRGLVQERQRGEQMVAAGGVAP